MKPIVGVMPLWDDERDSIWMLPGYMDGISRAGGTPFIFPFSRDREELLRLVAMCDGILFTGGHDVSPEVYGEAPMESLISCCEKRDIMELLVLEIAMKEEKSMLGICRGLQFINGALGGSLYQDLPTQHPSAVEHHQQPPYDKPIHEVLLTGHSPLQSCVGTEKLLVNSCHHQGIKELAPPLQEMAVSPDGLIEAFCLPAQKFLWAVQWHPEFFGEADENSRKIFQAFVDSM